MPEATAAGAATEPPKFISDAIANIKDTTKWIIASLGAVLTVMLGGIQLNAVGFARPGGPGPWVVIALVLVALVILATLWLGTYVLVSPGVSLDELMTKTTLAPVRTYLNTRWRHLYDDRPDMLTEVNATYVRMARQVRERTIPPNDPAYLGYQTLVSNAVHTAAWRMTLMRFHCLTAAFLVLVPFAIGAAVIIASHAALPGDGKPLDPPQAVMLTPSPQDAALLAAAGIDARCRGPTVPVLVYLEDATGVSIAVTYPDQHCPARRLLLLNRSTVLRVLAPA